MLTINTQRMNNVNTQSIDTDSTFSRMTTILEIRAARLVAARKGAGFGSRTPVAERLGEGFSVSAIQAHENGRNEVKTEKLRVYANLYNVPVDWLAGTDVKTLRDGLNLHPSDATKALSNMEPPQQNASANTPSGRSVGAPESFVDEVRNAPFAAQDRGREWEGLDTGPDQQKNLPTAFPHKVSQEAVAIAMRLGAYGLSGDETVLGLNDAKLKLQANMVLANIAMKHGDASPSERVNRILESLQQALEGIAPPPPAGSAWARDRTHAVALRLLNILALAGSSEAEPNAAQKAG